MDRPLLQWIGSRRLHRLSPVLCAAHAWPARPATTTCALRLLAAGLCLLLALRRWWPARLRGWYLAYSYLVVFYCLSFLLSYTMLQNHGGTPSVVNMVMGAVLVILLADWRNTIAMLVGGYAARAGRPAG